MKWFSLMSTWESSAVLVKILWISNDVFWIILINFHDTWVHCCRWKNYQGLVEYVYVLRHGSSHDLCCHGICIGKPHFHVLFCVSIRSVFSLLLFIWWVWSYGSSNWTEFAFWRGWWIFAWGGPVFLDLSLFLWN